MTTEPASLEIWITIAAGSLGRGVYQSYINRLPLDGSERVIELGPGAGNSTRPLAERLNKGGSVTAVDVSSRWIKTAWNRLQGYPNVRLHLGDLSKLNIPDRSFDAALIHFVIHDIPSEKQMGVLEGLTAKVKPGGRLFVREPLRFIEAERLRNMLCHLGWQEQQSDVEEVFSQGKAYEGIWVRV